MGNKTEITVGAPAASLEPWLEQVRRQVSSLQFGTVLIVVHNARVTQIDRTERLRLDPPPTLSFSNPPDHWTD
jgi:hypothetical protein